MYDILTLEVYMKKITLINILIIILLFCLIELFLSLKNAFSNPIDYKFYDVPKQKFERPVYLEHSKKRPIIILGDSIAYGFNLDENSNMAAILAKLTGRPVFNTAQIGWSPAHMLKLLKESRKLFSVNNPEYIIYTFVEDYKRKLFYYQGWKYSSQLYFRYYMDRNGELFERRRHYPFYWNFQTIKHIQYAIEKINYSNQKTIDKLLFKIFEESIYIIKNRYPNAKLVMLLYDQKMCQDDTKVDIFKTEKILTKIEQKKFKDLGFEIINMEELAGKTFCAEKYHSLCSNNVLDKNHPSSKMWEEFLPKLVEKLNM